MQQVLTIADNHPYVKYADKYTSQELSHGNKEAALYGYFLDFDIRLQVINETPRTPLRSARGI